MEWIKTRFDICTDKPAVDFVAWDGRFYMEASYPGSKEEPSSELKKLYALICREIKKSSLSNTGKEEILYWKGYGCSGICRKNIHPLSIY